MDARATVHPILILLPAAELPRYIHLNPVRAHLVQSPEEYPWSSHRDYLGLEEIPWLTTDWVLSFFASNRKDARAAYTDFIALEREEEGHDHAFHFGSVNDSRVLGDDTFIDTVLTTVEAISTPRITLDTILHCVCLLYGITETDLASPGKYRLFSEARGVAAWLILETGSVTLTALSRFSGRDISTLSAAAKTIRLRAVSDQEFATFLGTLQKLLLQIT